MSVQFQELLNLIDDHISAKTGNIDIDRKKRQANEAIRYFQRKVGLPSDEKIHSFYFSDDQFFYDGPTDFQEEMHLVYNDSSLNRDTDEWDFRPYAELIKKTGNFRGKLWSVTPINGQWQMMLLGTNQVHGTIIDTLDSVGDWLVSGDASSLSQDLLEKKVGDGSLSFDITNSAGVARIYDDTVSLDVQSLFENHGYFKVWNFMTDNNIDSVALKLFVDASNYWTITVTADDAGVAFAENSWIKIGFPLDDAVKTGTPEIDETVTKIQFEWDLGAGFVSAADFRIDHIFTAIPDKMDMIYRSNYVGTDSTGATNKSSLTENDDLLAIGNFMPDVVDLVARRAALTLWPGLRADKEFWAIYKSELKEFIQDHGRRWPRTRTNKYQRTALRR